ncbi:MAG: TetR/AcrR family transcriptional regulator [Bacteroidetes bacterium]|nr:MAG: TetR/AcrR family transcriptional regulator [Bacteroidota bacterium]
MARPREFDADIALNKAMDLFWTKGYCATTTRDIVNTVGIGRQSIYNAFGGKESLFRRCLEHYEKSILDPRFTDLERKGASKTEIVRFVAQAVEFYDLQQPRKGCMLANTAVESSNSIPEAAAQAASYLDRLISGFSHAISNASERRELKQSLDHEAVARSLACTVLGMAVASKSGSTREELVDMASVALRPLY